MNQPSLILLLCLSPLAVIFTVMKLALWIGETASFAAKTKELERMQHGPYMIWDDDGEEDEWD
jgi:predicted membrane protein